MPQSGVPLTHSWARCAHHPTGPSTSAGSKRSLRWYPFQETIGVMSSWPVLLEERIQCSCICKGSISRADVGAESSGAQKWSERCPQEQNNYREISRERFYRFPYTPSLVEEFKAFQISPATAPIAPHHGQAPVVSTGCLLQCLLCPSFCKEITEF